MLIKEVVLNTNTCASSWSLYVIGDAHVGAVNCAEDKLQKIVQHIEKDPNAIWVGGGDLCDAVIINDLVRFDPSTLPNWLLQGKTPHDVRENLQDILTAQKRRLLKILSPIKNKCIGFIEGNHEYSIMKHHNRNLIKEICDEFSTTNLTDCAFIRLKFCFKPKSTVLRSATVRVFITHGYGNGAARTIGTEVNKLYQLSLDKECDIVLRGHSHTFCIHPPIPILSIPSKGEMHKDPYVKYKYAANWGSYLYTYQTGPSTYASRANYPVRPMYTFQIDITPFRKRCNNNVVNDINIHQIRL